MLNNESNKPQIFNCLDNINSKMGYVLISLSEKINLKYLLLTVADLLFEDILKKY